MTPSKNDSFGQQFMEYSLNLLAQSLQRQLSDGLTEMVRQGFGVEKSGERALAGATAGQVSVVINNNAPVGVTARETTDSYDRKQLEITIDQMVANALVQGRQTSGVLGTLFNVVPGLIGR